MQVFPPAVKPCGRRFKNFLQPAPLMHCAPSSKSNTAKRRMHFHFSARPCSRILSSKVKKRQAQTCLFLEVTPGFEPGNQGFADPCLTTWLCHHRGTSILYANFSKKSTFILDFNAHTFVWALIWSGQRGSNSLPPPWQGGALPDELCPQVVPRAGIEPATRGFSVHCSTN